LAAALEKLIREPELRRRLGADAYQWARAEFLEEPYIAAVNRHVFDALGAPT
jgi:hypothetical protein